MYGGRPRAGPAAGSLPPFPGGIAPTPLSSGSGLGWVGMSLQSGGQHKLSRCCSRFCWGQGWGRGSGWPVCSPQIQHTEDMENEIDELLQEFEEKSGRAFLHTVCFY